MKKIISFVLAIIMVFAIGATALAATVGSVPEHEHDWSDWRREGDHWERTCEECGLTEIRGAEEANPNTGAPVFGTAAVVAAAACAVFAGKK